MAEAKSRAAPFVSGCAVSTHSRIPKLTPRTEKEDGVKKTISPRVSRLPAPTTRTGLRKSTSEMSPHIKHAPVTKSSFSESTIPKKAAKTSFRPPPSPRSVITPRTLRPPSIGTSSTTRPTKIRHGAFPKKTSPAHSRPTTGYLKDVSDEIYEVVCSPGENVTSLLEQKARPGLSDSDSSISSQNSKASDRSSQEDRAPLKPIQDCSLSHGDVQKESHNVAPLECKIIDEYATVLAAKEEKIRAEKEEQNKIWEQIEASEEEEEKR